MHIFAEDPAKAELYRQYQELKCPMTEEPGQEISNECYRSVSDRIVIAFNSSDVYSIKEDESILIDSSKPRPIPFLGSKLNDFPD